MFSNDCSVEITFHYFYIVFDYSWFIKLKLKCFKLLFFPIIYSSSIVLWSFIYHICVVYCWPFCYHWLDQCSFILKLPLGCYWKISVGHIQIGYTDLFPPQVCGRSVREFRLDVQTFLLQLIAFLDIKYPSSSSFKPSFVDCWLMCIIFIGPVFKLFWNFFLVVIENCQWDVSKPYISICFPHRCVEVRGKGSGFCGLTCRHQCTDCIQYSSSISSILQWCR